jgi:hypothetical protein
MVNTKSFRPEDIETAVRACLAEVPFVRIGGAVKDRAKSESPRDLVLKIRSAGGTQQLVVESRTSGEPRLAREVIAALRRYSETQPKSYAVFVAPYISPRTADLCCQEGVGYVDLSGNCRLCFDEVYVEREGRPNKFAQKRDLRKLYSPKASRVLRVLLNAPRKAWTVSALAREAQVSIGLAWKVKELLADREWVSSQSDGVLLKQPEDLLAEWARNYSYRQNGVRDYYSMQKPAQLESALAAACANRQVRYALTSFSAAERMAPMVRYQRVFAFVTDSAQEFAAGLGLKEVSSGANVTLMDPYDDGVFYGGRAFDGVQAVSPVQAYLDLFSNKGRGEEAAEALLREVIRPQW